MTSSLADLSDAELVALCQARLPDDTRAFRTLVRRYQQKVFATCYRIMGNHQDAEELTQEVFLKVYQSLGRFEGRSTFSTWLYAIAVNACRNAIRKRERRAPISDITIDELDEVLPGRALDPRDVFSARERSERLQSALDALDDDSRAILVLREIDGLPYREIAEILKLSLSATKMRIHRARHAWRAQLNRLMEQDSEGSHG